LFNVKIVLNSTT